MYYQYNLYRNEGVSAAFYGVLLRGSNVVTIDGAAVPSGSGQMTQTTGNDTVGLLYQSPTLSDGDHVITLGSPEGSSGYLVDYMTVQAGNDTSLQGKPLIIDDDDSSIIYTGDWMHNESVLIDSRTGDSRLQYRGGIYQTNTSRDTMAVQFAGVTKCKS